MDEKHQYRSNYEWKCANCDKPIKSQTPYHIRQKRIIVAGDKILDVQRIHVECPEVKDGNKI